MRQQGEPAQGQQYDAVVAGAGLAGLTAAAYLCRSGYRVLICERSGRTGGLVSSFQDRGFTFDAGIRAFENSGIVYPMLRQLGIEMPCVSNPVSVGIAGEMVRFGSRASLAEYVSLLQRLFPAEAGAVERIAAEIRKVIQYMDVLYGIDNPLFEDEINNPEYLLKTLLPWLLKYQINIRRALRLTEPVNDYLRRFTGNQALIDMITQHFFKETPTFFALSYFGLYLDYSYPTGGTGVLADKMTSYVTRNHGEILLRTEINGIDLARKQVRTADGRVFGFRELVWAADSKALYRSLSLDSVSDAGQRRRIEEQRDLAMAGRGGDSVLTLFLAVNREPAYFAAACGAHCFFTPETTGLSAVGFERWPEFLRQDASAQPDARPVSEAKNALKQLMKSYLGATTYEISCPALRDPALSPPGQTGVIVSTLVDHALVKQVRDDGWYEEFKDLCQERIIEVLDATLFAGFRSDVLFAQSSTPLTIERLTGNTDGAITGWAFTNDRMPAESQFQRIARSVTTPIPHVYQAGQWSFSPSGLPISILTGKLAADRAAKELKAEKSPTSRGPA